MKKVCYKNDIHKLSIYYVNFKYIFFVDIRYSRREDVYCTYNLDEEKLKCALSNRNFFFFGKARKLKMLYFESDVGIRCIYLSLTLGTAKFKQLD